MVRPCAASLTACHPLQSRRNFTNSTRIIPITPYPYSRSLSSPLENWPTLKWERGRGRTPSQLCLASSGLSLCSRLTRTLPSNALCQDGGWAWGLGPWGWWLPGVPKPFACPSESLNFSGEEQLALLGCWERWGRRVSGSVPLGGPGPHNSPWGCHTLA